MLVEIYGTLSAAAMVLMYSLEDRSRSFTLGFSTACLAAAVYAALIGSVPFAVLEGLWALIALRRWRVRGAADRVEAAP